MLTALTIFFILLKLTGWIAWSWKWVLFPSVIGIFLIVLHSILKTVADFLD